jgi:tetratricopeptide (TPR) repeat protein
MQQVSLRDYCEDAGLFIQSGEPHKAVHITRHILRHYPRHVESYRLLGQALLAAGDYQEAAKQFRRVLGADPEDVSSRVGLAEIHQARGDLDSAVRHMQRAVDLSPGDSDLRARLGQLNDARQGDGRPGMFEITRAALGRIHARAGLHAKAVQEFKAVLESDPGRGDVQTALAEIFWRDGDYLEAVEVCQRILEKLPNALKANLMIGALWLENQQPDAAQPYLALAQELDPDNLVAQSLLGEASSLPLLEVKIEPLGEDELQSVQFGPPPTSPEEDVPASQEQDLAIDWMGDSHEEGSKPMSDEERADEEFELPDWLQGVGDDLLGESDDQPAASSPPELDAEEGEEKPDWLSDLVARVEDPDASEESVPAEPGDVPDWLQQLRPEVPEELPSGSDAPDWLESTVADQPPDDLFPSEPELPEMEPVAPEFTVEPLPGEAEDEQVLADEGVDLPAVGETPPVAPVAEVGGAGVPDWLEEIRQGETSPETDAEPAVEEVEPSLLEPVTDVVEESEVPDWLRDITTAEALPSDEAEPVTEPEPPQPTPEVEVEEAGLPDWIRDFEEPAAEVEGAEPEPVGPEFLGEPTATADEGRAMWEQILAEEGVDLGSVEEAPPPEAAGLTPEEWLRSTADLDEVRPAAEELEEPVEVVQEAEIEEVVEVEVDEAGLPDWLREPAAEEGEFVEPEAVPTAETPEWLTELESEDMLPAEIDFEEPVELETGEMPEWLGEVLAEEPPLAEEWVVEPVEAEAGEEQIPDWLREFREQEGEVELEPAGEVEELEVPAEVGEEAQYGEPSELPDWLQALREGVEMPPPPEEPAVAEIETSVEAEAAPLEEEVGPPPVDELLVTEEGLPELEVAEEEGLLAVEVTPPPEEVIELPPAEPELEPVEEPVPELAVEEPVPELVEEIVEALEPVVTRELEALRVEELPRDPAARLSMARAASDTGDWSDALTIYETLVSSSEMLDSVIDNLEEAVRSRPDDPSGYQLLGDACMKDGRLHAALEAYRVALSKL